MIEIRQAGIMDASSLAGLHAESFGAECWGIDSFNGTLMLLTTQGFIASADGQTAGFILCQATDGELDVLTFCVSPTRRKQGIGEALIRHAVNHNPAPVSVHLEVAADNLAARRLYERCGFSLVGIRKGYYRRGAEAVDGVTYGYARVC